MLHFLECVSDLLHHLNGCGVGLGVRPVVFLAPHSPPLQLNKYPTYKERYGDDGDDGSGAHHAEEVRAESLLAAIVVSGLDAVLDDGQGEIAVPATARGVGGLTSRSG